jgi:hypothetical protein
MANVLPFDQKAFLSNVGAGRTLGNAAKISGRAFSQGDNADSVFYIQKGKSCF